MKALNKIMIAACDVNFGIGNKGHLLFRIPGDMEFFRDHTLGNVVVMGYKTFLSIHSKPLRDRINIVLTKEHADDPKLQDPKIHVCTHENLYEILEKIDLDKANSIYFMGGESIYQRYIDEVECIYLTTFDRKYTADTHFPNPEEHGFKKVRSLVAGFYHNHIWAITKFMKHND